MRHFTLRRNRSPPPQSFLTFPKMPVSSRKDHLPSLSPPRLSARSVMGGASGSEGWEGTQQGVARQGSWVELTGCRRKGDFHSHPDTTAQGWLLASVSSSHTSTMKRLLCSLLGLLCAQVCCESGCQHSGHLRGSGSEHGGVGWGEQLRSPAELPPSQRAWVCSGLCGHCNGSHPCLFLCF